MSCGANPQLTDGEGYAGIHLASQFAHAGIVGYLLAKGCDADLRDKNGKTALMWSSLRVYAHDPARLLLTFNASPNLVDATKGQTAAHWAAMSGNDLAIEHLWDAGADFSLKNTQVTTYYII